MNRIPIEILIDLDQDSAQVFYNGSLVTEYPWTAGAFGDGQGALDLAAVNFNATGSTSVYYDYVSVVPIIPCPWDCEVVPNGLIGTADLLTLLSQWGGPDPVTSTAAASPPAISSVCCRTGGRAPERNRPSGSSGASIPVPDRHGPGPDFQ